SECVSMTMARRCSSRAETAVAGREGQPATSSSAPQARVANRGRPLIAAPGYHGSHVRSDLDSRARGASIARLERTERDTPPRGGDRPLPLAAPRRTGVIVGVGMGGISSVEEMYLGLAAQSVRRVSPFLIPRIIPNMASGQIAIRYGARGPNYATTSACASGAHALGEALVLIRDGRQDVMLAGGAEAPICLLGVGGFSAMRALATNFNDEPA